MVKNVHKMGENELNKKRKNSKNGSKIDQAWWVCGVNLLCVPVVWVTEGVLWVCMCQLVCVCFCVVSVSVYMWCMHVVCVCVWLCAVYELTLLLYVWLMPGASVSDWLLTGGFW